MLTLPLADILKALEAPDARVQISGAKPAVKAAAVAQLVGALPHPALVVAPSLDAAETMAYDIRFVAKLTGQSLPVHVIPDWNPSFPPPIDLEARRVEALDALQGKESRVFLAPFDALKAPLVSPAVFRGLTRDLARGQTIGREAFMAFLVEAGYDTVSTVTVPGETAIRGGIIDCFSPGSDTPVRIELNGDEIASLRMVDPTTQRSIGSIDRVRLLPAPARVHGDEAATLASYLSPDTLLVLDEPDVVFERAGDQGSLGPALETRPSRRVTLHSLGIPPPSGWNGVTLDIPSPQTLGFATAGHSVGEQLARLEALRQKALCIVVCRTKDQAARLKTIVGEHGIPASDLPDAGRPQAPYAIPHPLFVTVGALSTGWYSEIDRLVLLTEEELFGKERLYRPSRRARLAPFLSSIEDLHIGDLAVHADYGVGRYDGLTRMAVEGAERDFLVLRYLGGDKVYVPVDRLDLIQKYAGVEGKSPRMDVLGGTGWVKTKQKVQRQIERMATDLLQLYAAREIASGHAFSPDGIESREFAAGFEYEETPDQARAIVDVTADMERPRPMDRLVCGDVGYGKTEVAMRAAFKAVMDRKQVAVLVPTTLLAQQHGVTFAKRLAPFAVRVEVMSRFRPLAEQRAVLAGLADGQVDVVIGTHRLFQKDVAFRDLGLLVVDEEQRFGVRHKERFKELRKSVDVLTLTATPIPRTLQMAFAGARDVSLIETPPADRLAIRTTLSPFDPRIIREAVERELARDGQVFFVHNRVADIERIAEFLHSLIPGARIVVGHGQMREQQLERVMAKFLAREADMLLSTTIIEAGLDIPSANTILIDRADQFGLAELYQLRGRVGRSDRQAYTVLLIPQESSLTEDARRRLEALQEFTELGSGFKIAARDLEIRGAGNLLGREQSGHIAAVGFDLYLKMIQETVQTLRGEEPPPEVEPSLSLPVSAFIPEEYIHDAYHRLVFYKRVAAAESEEALTAIRVELADRFGPVPEPVERLLEVMAIKQKARRLALVKVEVGDRSIVIATSPNRPLPRGVTDALLKTYPRTIRFLSEYSFMIAHAATNWNETRSRVDELLQRLGACGTQDAVRP